jgi:threonine synthase
MLADTLKLLKNVSAFSCEASSAAAFAALNQLKPGQHERVLVVNTGTIDIERSAP